MTRTYNVLRESQKVKILLSIIKSHYRSSNKNFIQEVNLTHITNRIKNTDIRVLVVSIWKDLELTTGNEIRLLENRYHKDIISKIFKNLLTYI